MDKYNFNFHPKNCNKVYFKELLLLMNTVSPDKESFKRVNKKQIKKLNIKCENELNTCKTDEFFFDNKKQIILGRLFDTIGCYYKCKGHYFSMAMEPFSVFKNDVFIRYIIDKPELFINNSNKIELEDVFPIRIVISDKHDIPSHYDKILDNIDEYTFDYFKNMVALSNDNLKIIDTLPETSLLKKIITDKYPVSNIISRELCMLHYMKLHFYIVENDDKTIKPFILISKYNLKQIKNIYQKKNKTFPNIKYLFNKQSKTIKKRYVNYANHNKTKKFVKT